MKTASLVLAIFVFALLTQFGSAEPFIWKDIEFVDQKAFWKAGDDARRCNPMNSKQRKSINRSGTP
jgi:hypothetical protein